MLQHLNVWDMPACSIGSVVRAGLGFPFFRFFGVSSFRCVGISVFRYLVPAQDPPEPVHFVLELADLAFLLVDDGADHGRVVRWHVLVSEQLHGIAVVFLDDPLVAVNRDGKAGVSEIVHRLAHGPALEDEHGGVRGTQGMKGDVGWGCGHPSVCSTDSTWE